MPKTKTRRDKPFTPVPAAAALVAPATAVAGEPINFYGTGLNPDKAVLLRVTDEDGNFGWLPALRLPDAHGDVGPFVWTEWDAGDLTVDLCQQSGEAGDAVYLVIDTATVTVA